MPARHNFTAQTTRQKRLSNGDNAVAYFFCCSSSRGPKTFIRFFIHLKIQFRLWVLPEERSRFMLSTLNHLCREQHFRHRWRPVNHLATLCHEWLTIPKPLDLTKMMPIVLNWYNSAQTVLQAINPNSPSGAKYQINLLRAAGCTVKSDENNVMSAALMVPLTFPLPKCGCGNG
jgi:hypothetical protein